MSSRVTIHLGAPKTGTTFLQSVLFKNKGALAGHGVLVPGKRANDHVLAAGAVRNGPGSRNYPLWENILDEIESWDGSAIISNEWFPMAGPEETAEAVSRLQQVGELHLVVTARDLVDQVPAAWQETLKLGDSTQIDEFVDKLEQNDFRWGWWMLDTAQVLERWGAHVPAENVHVVTVPPRGSRPGLLWERFSDACGIDSDWCSTDVDFVRESLSVEAARFLQLAGPRLLDAVDAVPPNWTVPLRWIGRHLSQGMLLKHRGGRITMSEVRIPEVRARALRSIGILQESGYVLHGEWSDLASSKLPDGAVHPDDVPDSDVLDVAIDVVAQQLRHARRVARTRKESAPPAGDVDSRKVPGGGVARLRNGSKRLVKRLRAKF